MPPDPLVYMCLCTCTQGFAPPLFYKHSFRPLLDQFLNEGLVWYAFHLGTLRTCLALFNNLPNFSQHILLYTVSHQNWTMQILWEWNKYYGTCGFLCLLSHLSLHNWSIADIRYTDRLVSRPDENKASTVQIHYISTSTCLKVTGD